jgi:hypothetical protein
MPTQLLERPANANSPQGSTPANFTQAKADPGYDALPRFIRLAADIAIAAKPQRQSRWKEPAVFFFDRRRQAEYEVASPPAPQADPFAELSSRITAELQMLFASVELRQVARAVTGLRSSAEMLASQCAAAGELAAILAMPDDEVVTVLHPLLRTGFRFVVRGVADIGQLSILFADAASEQLPGAPVPRRFVAACRDVDSVSAAGVPMVAESRFQMYMPTALRADGTLPSGLGGCDHWLWPSTPLANVPRIEGERVVLLGPPAYRATWENSRRFPAMMADVRLLDVLNPFRVAERLGTITGTTVSPTVPREQEKTLAKAA